jgi:ATP-dependent Lhr-like helicase
MVEFLSRRGASFLPDIVAATRRLSTEVEDTLWKLAAMGLVTTDGFGPVRAMVSGAAKRVRQSARFRRRSGRRMPTSRWSLLYVNPPPLAFPDTMDGTASGSDPWGRPEGDLAEPSEAGLTHDDILEARAWQLLLRYGVVFPEVLGREALAPRWRELLQVYRRAEARGEIRGGRFVSGFVGEQFAMPEAVKMMRAVRKAEPDGRPTILSACDPLNLAGVLTPGPRVPALLGNRIAFRDGVPVASLQSGEIHYHADLDPTTGSEVTALMSPPRGIKASRQPVSSPSGAG